MSISKELLPFFTSIEKSDRLLVPFPNSILIDSCGMTIELKMKVIKAKILFFIIYFLYIIIEKLELDIYSIINKGRI